MPLSSICSSDSDTHSDSTLHSDNLFQNCSDSASDLSSVDWRHAVHCPKKRHSSRKHKVCVDSKELDEIVSKLHKLRNRGVRDGHKRSREHSREHDREYERHHYKDYHHSYNTKYYCRKLSNALKHLAKLTKKNLNDLTLMKCKLKSGVFNSVMIVKIFENVINKFIKKLEYLVPAIFKSATFSMTFPTKVDIKFESELFAIGGNLLQTDSNTDLLKKLDDIYANHALFLRFVRLKYKCLQTRMNM